MESEPDFSREYNVELDAFRGPLDLLLYLIRRSEVDVYDIPIAEITTQYLSYIDLIRQVNITIAGEFVLMAATLMEIKSKMLLPRETLDEFDEDDDDPRMELVRQLLEYKRFKDAARMLEDAEEEQLRKFPRPAFDRSSLPPDVLDVDEDPFAGVGIWDLLTAFSKILKETNLNQPRVIHETDRPLKFYMAIIIEALNEQQRVQFAELFVDATDRQQVIGIFLALLELARMKRIKTEQVTEFGEIYIIPGEEGASIEELPDDEALGYGRRDIDEQNESIAEAAQAEQAEPPDVDAGQAEQANAQMSGVEITEADNADVYVAGLDDAGTDSEDVDDAGVDIGDGDVEDADVSGC